MIESLKEFPLDGAVAAITAVVGAFLLKWLDRLIGKEVRKESAESQLRSELRADVLVLRDKLDSAEKKMDEWREKYYALLQEYTLLRTRFVEIEQKRIELEHAASDLLREKKVLRGIIGST